MSAAKKKKSNKKNKGNKKVNKQKNINNNSKEIQNTGKNKNENSKSKGEKLLSDDETKVVESSKENVAENNNQLDKIKNEKHDKKKNDNKSNEKVKESKEPKENKVSKDKEDTKGKKDSTKDEKKELIEVQSKDISKPDEKPEYVQEMIKKQKKKMYIFITIILLIIFAIMFSTLFAIFNLKNTNNIGGVSIKNINVSNLNKEDTKSRITDAIEKELIAEIELKYGEEYSITLMPKQIEFKYDIDEAVENAYLVGRKGSVVENNYSIIFTTIFGKNVNLSYMYNEELLNQFLDDINAKLPGVVVEPTYYIEDNQLIINKGIDGIQIKKEELKEQIIQAIIDRNANKMADGFKQEIEIPIENVSASKIDIDKIYSEVHTEPQDAYYTTEPYQIYADVDGIDLAITVEEAKETIASEDKEEYIFDLKITEAEKKVDDLGTEAFPYLISSFSTKYDASNRNRSTNLELAATKINGKVLMPGEEFSFNKIVGRRTVEEGYKDAKIYADGGVVDGLAGGICQISSTLYNAVLLANLNVTERRNHTYTTSYVVAGRDATVVWGTTDFRFVNSRSYPIKIEATVSNGIAEFKIHGMQEEKEYEVKILPVTTQSIPYTTTYQEDATLLPGQQVVQQSGHAGYKVTTYKELRLNGEVVSKEVISNDTYSPMRTIIRVGSGTINNEVVQ